MAGTDPLGLARETLQAMFARSDDPYRGADLTTSRRATAALVGFCGLLSLAFFPLDPPTGPIDSAGWVVGSGLVAANFVVVALVLRRPSGFDPLLAASYFTAAQLAVLVWLAGGVSSDYEDLYVFAVGAGLVHPPRRAFPQVGFVLLCLAAPLAYDSSDSAVVTKVVAEAGLLIAVAGLLGPYLFQIRRQRFQLERGAEVERRLARVDSLTGLANRRAFDETLTVQISGAERAGEHLSVALIDVDGLKRINDRRGHLEGDRALVAVARALERAVRPEDRCFRWGGDEFVLLMPGTDRATGRSVLGRAAERVARECRDELGELLEISYGLAQLEQGGSAEDLLALADIALMEQKTEKQRG